MPDAPPPAEGAPNDDDAFAALALKFLDGNTTAAEEAQLSAELAAQVHVSPATLHRPSITRAH